MRGTASDVVGMLSATRFRNTVSDSRMVTPEADTNSQSLLCTLRVVTRDSENLLACRYPFSICVTL